MENRVFDDIVQYQASGRERLVELAAFLEELPADRLTFTRWYGQGKGCAVGLAAATNPWFQAQGLRLKQDAKSRTSWPEFAGESDRVAVSHFFGLSLAEMRDLLDPVGYDGDLEPHPKAVAQKIRQFVSQSVNA